MEEKLTNIFCTVLRITPADVAANPTLGDSEYWDSLQHMNLVAAIEQAFGIELSFEEIVAMKSFTEARAMLSGKLAQAAS